LRPYRKHTVIFIYTNLAQGNAGCASGGVAGLKPGIEITFAIHDGTIKPHELRCGKLQMAL
jgi:hypothetical protein